VKILRAQVVLNNCSECRDKLLLECRDFGLPLPRDEYILVPEHWAVHECPHTQDGLVLRFGLAAVPDQTEIEVEVDLGLDGEEFEGWNDLDATKGIGYPAREEGRYGSYPSHDGFDDESEP
jgi:hypothetical protein